ncbi:MAG: Serine/threonine-protein phosphatase 2A activator 1 [Chaenotheca gracillima]|nr:MAG: Serine/threonine-protein phosphatase 2A activator 1 [Chaenotheca gracillima]
MNSGASDRHVKAETSPSRSKLRRLDPAVAHIFTPPSKRIHEGEDVSSFLVSQAYSNIMTFLFQLNEAMFPIQLAGGKDQGKAKLQAWEIGSDQVTFSETVQGLRGLLAELDAIFDEAPPDTGPRRFGNVSFRTWYQIVEKRIPELLEKHLPQDMLRFGHTAPEGANAIDELSSYLLGSFGSSQRLDYGTGHELSFLAFLGSIWMLGGFNEEDQGNEERGIVLGVFDLYLALIRRLIKTYSLEPAGSHGVWGLDDHSFIPYIFGSAQFSPAMSVPGQMPTEGSLFGAPDPGSIDKAAVVERERKRNLYFGAVGFIYDVKTGPFWEHSPYLYDISGVRAGWAKINKGMIKMYNAEVLSKFPVVQHFPFGSLFSWDRDPEAVAVPSSVHTTSQPSKPALSGHQSEVVPPAISTQAGTKAPWASATPSTSARRPVQTAAPSAPYGAGSASGPGPPTRAPWAAGTPSVPSTNAAMPTTRAPWAKSDPKETGG